MLKIEDGSRKHAFIGLGLNEWNEAFDFNMALSNHEKHMKKEGEKEVGNDGSEEIGDGVYYRLCYTFITTYRLIYK